MLIGYTLAGDANLDGSVDTVDFGFLAQNFSGSGKAWNQGDFNYDGTTNTADFTALSQNFNQLLPAPALWAFVPEPSAGLCLACSIFLRRRQTARRRRIS